MYALPVVVTVLVPPQWQVEKYLGNHDINTADHNFSRQDMQDFSPSSSLCSADEQWAQTMRPDTRDTSLGRACWI
jgi:hypothetical protein